jgi:hypothetical protein
LILNLLGIKRKAAPRVYRSDDGGRFVVVTGHRATPEGSLQMGRLVSLENGIVGDEEPTDSIAYHMPMSNFQPYPGELPPEVRRLLELKGITPG